MEDNPPIISQREVLTNGYNGMKRKKMISLFKCDICEAKYNSSNCLHDEFFERECSCCGSADHSFLDVRYGSEDKNLISLICACPLANPLEIEGKRLSVNNRKHWIDPTRIARECGYQEKEVDYESKIDGKNPNKGMRTSNEYRRHKPTPRGSPSQL
jgi:Zn ribbon nucleic-acid-binding protein